MNRAVRQWFVFIIGVAVAVAAGLMVLLAFGLPLPAHAEVENLRAELSRIREIKGCGRLEVRPKPPPGERPA